MTKAAPECQQEPHQRALLAVLAVDRPHQREVEQDGDAGGCQHAHRGRQDRRNPVLHDERDDDRREDHDLPVGEVEDAAEPVDERHPDAEEAERQPEHDPVEDHRRHATPRYARRTSGFWSSSCDVPTQPDATVLEHVAPVGHGQRERHLLLRDQQRHPVLLEPVERLERLLGDLGGKSRRRLVEQQQPWPRHERAPDGHHLLLAAAQGARLLPMSFPQPREEVVDELQRLVVRPPGIRAQHEVRLDRHRREEVPLGRDVRDPRAGDPVGGATGQILPVEDDATFHRREQAGNCPEERRLARAVRADDRHRLAGADLDVDPVDDPLAEVPRREPGDLKQRGPARDTRRRPAGPA